MNNSQTVGSTLCRRAYIFLVIAICLSGCGASPSKTFRPEGWVETAPFVWTTSRGQMNIEASPMTRAFMDSSVSVDFKIRNISDSPITIEIENVTLYLKGGSITGRLYYSNSEGRYTGDYGSVLKAGKQIVPSNGSLSLIGSFSPVPMSLPNKLNIKLRIKTHLGEDEVSIPMIDCGNGCSNQ